MWQALDVGSPPSACEDQTDLMHCKPKGWLKDCLGIAVAAKQAGQCSEGILTSGGGLTSAASGTWRAAPLPRPQSRQRMQGCSQREWARPSNCNAALLREASKFLERVRSKTERPSQCHTHVLALYV